MKKVGQPLVGGSLKCQEGEAFYPCADKVQVL